MACFTSGQGGPAFLSESKTDLRRRFLTARLSISGPERHSAEAVLTQRLVSFVDTSLPAIAGYVAQRGEPDISPALAALHHQGVTVALPVTRAGMMHFLEWTPGEALAPGGYGIPEPAGNREIIPRIVLVPLVAFDRMGHRLGYGKGYYDRALPLLKQNGAQAVGVAFSVQESAGLPAEAHDVALDAIVTEKEIIRP